MSFDNQHTKRSQIVSSNVSFFSFPYSQFMSSQTVFFLYYFCCLSSLLHYFVIERIETNASRKKRGKTYNTLTDTAKIERERKKRNIFK